MNLVAEKTVWVLAEKWNTGYTQYFVPPGIQKAKTPRIVSNKCCLAILLKESKPKAALEGTVAGEQTQADLVCSETVNTLMKFLSDKLMLIRLGRNSLISMLAEGLDQNDRWQYSKQGSVCIIGWHRDRRQELFYIIPSLMIQKKKQAESNEIWYLGGLLRTGQSYKLMQSKRHQNHRHRKAKGTKHKGGKQNLIKRNPGELQAE